MHACDDQKELSKLPARISNLEASRQDLTEALTSSGGSPQEVADIGTRLAALIEELDTAETRWLELSDMAEQLATDPPATTIAGVLLIVAGVVWILQGMGSTFAPQSFMTNTKIWIPIGAMTASAGTWLTWWAWKGKKR